ncbi:hypothetical protein ACNJX9_34090 [Bradyrhizobium sp. DASA03076]|uniref:hypothetical protein n=1 Tax=Bradyrhizobium sp. BLXBL-03 TaxID=3395916 RepID=UPI003F702B83
MNQIFDPTNWDLLSLLKTAVGAGIGTAAVQGGIALYRERTLKNEHAAYLALRLAVLLEAYASECCDFYFDNANAEQLPNEPYPSWNTRLPDLPEYPDDTEAWRTLDKKLLAKCLNFPNRVHASQNAIAACGEHTMDDLDIALDEHASARGAEAWEIASALRETYGLDRAEIVFDYYTALQKVLKQSREKRKRREEGQWSFLSEISAREKDFPT